MKKFLDEIKKSWQWITLLTAVIGGFWSVFHYFDKQNDEMARAIQMSEKAIIWNKEIPVIERASVCDDYLSRGYNSYTKKLCENVILQDERLTEAESSNEQTAFLMEGGKENEQ